MNKIKAKKGKKIKKEAPLLSVIMPVYNAEAYLASSIKSILKQTFKKFELIIVDDASTDASWDIINRFAKKYPSRIRIVRNEKNRGLFATFNAAAALSESEYIARQDADDIALPDRLARQIEYLVNHPKTVATSGQYIIIDSVGKIIGEKTLPATFKNVYEYILHLCPAIAPALMIARKRLPRDFAYNGQSLKIAEDAQLLFKLLLFGKVENLSDHLLLHRIYKKTAENLGRKDKILAVASSIKGNFTQPLPVGRKIRKQYSSLAIL